MYHERAGKDSNYGTSLLEKSFHESLANVFAAKPTFEIDNCVFVFIPFLEVVSIDVPAFFEQKSGEFIH